MLFDINTEEKAPKPVGWAVCFLLMTSVLFWSQPRLFHNQQKLFCIGQLLDPDIFDSPSAYHKNLNKFRLQFGAEPP